MFFIRFSLRQHMGVLDAVVAASVTHHTLHFEMIATHTRRGHTYGEHSLILCTRYALDILINVSYWAGEDSGYHNDGRIRMYTESKIQQVTHFSTFG